MSSESEFVVIPALAQLREQLIAHARSLRKNQAVDAVSDKLDVREYPEGGLQIEAYVDAELKNGEALTWWLEARLNDGVWTVDGSLTRNSSGLQDLLEQVKPRTCTTPSDLAQALGAVARELIAIPVLIHGQPSAERGHRV